MNGNPRIGTCTYLPVSRGDEFSGPTGIKQRYRLMHGFKQGKGSARLCRLFDEIRAFLRPQAGRNQTVSLRQRRDLHQDRFARLIGLMAVV
jgi:hypothetical protein